jgi:hypothetical protein
MSIRLVLILSLVLVSIYADDKAAAPAASKAASSDSKSSGSKDEKKGDKKDSEEKDSKNKMKVGGGLYTTDKVANVKSMKGNRPTMRLVSPMQRSTVSKHYDDDDEGKYGSYTLADLNPNLRPCGGTKPGKIHFTAEMESKAFIAWKTMVPDETGNCTIKLSDGADDQDFEVLLPLDNTAFKKR